MVGDRPDDRVKECSHLGSVHLEAFRAFFLHFAPGPYLFFCVQIKPLDEPIHFLSFDALFDYLL